MAFDALVLLGCRVEPASLPGPAERRVERAARAFHDGLAPLVVVSGGRRWHGALEAERLAAALVARGVPESALLREEQSRNTLENARCTRALLALAGRTRIGLVSCDWHLPRALWIFRRAGFEVEPLPAPSPPVPLHRRALRSFRENGAWLLGRAAVLAW
jgi:uncharacterized SAM-binding protein YcdF (DUF218 family)